MNFRRLFLSAFSVIATTTTLFSSTALAQQVIWQQKSFFGSQAYCKPSNLQTLFTGNDASFIFSNIIVNIKPSTSVNFYLPVNCTTSTKLTVPKGYTIANIFSRASGGILKDIGIQASLTSRLYLMISGSSTAAFIGRSGTQFMAAKTTFPFQAQVNEPIFDVNIDADLNVQEKTRFCIATAKSAYTIDFNHRFELDAVRSQLNRGMTLEMVSEDVSILLESCPAAKTTQSTIAQL